MTGIWGSCWVSEVVGRSSWQYCQTLLGRRQNEKWRSLSGSQEPISHLYSLYRLIPFSHISFIHKVSYTLNPYTYTNIYTVCVYMCIMWWPHKYLSRYVSCLVCVNLYIYNIFQAKGLTLLPRLASLGQLSLSSGDHRHMERKPQYWQAVQEPIKCEALSIPNTEEGKKPHSSQLLPGWSLLGCSCVPAPGRGGGLAPEGPAACAGLTLVRVPVGNGWPLFNSCFCSCWRKRGGTSRGR